MDGTAKAAFEFHRMEVARPDQWLYLFGDEGLVYSEARNRFAGLNAMGVAAYLAFDSGARLQDLAPFPIETASGLPSGPGLDAIRAMSRGIFPAEEQTANWPDAATDLGAAEIEIHNIPVLLEVPEGRLGDRCRDYFRNCPGSDRPAQFHVLLRQAESGWAVFVNGHSVVSLGCEEQAGLGLMHAARSLLYAKGEYDIAVHAAVVAHGDDAWMLCAPRESGKSTLAAYLVTLGNDLVTDEPALLHLGTRTVLPLRLPISLKEGSWQILERDWPGLENAPTHVRSDGMKIRMAHPAANRWSSRPPQLRHILFVEYDPISAARAEQLSPIETLRLLNESGLLLANNLKRDRFEDFCRLLCLTPAHRIRYGCCRDAWDIMGAIDYRIS